MGRSVPKVLMLGWEFPPIINGGLGVACHDLSGAMSELSEITMIVPKSSKDFKVKKLNLIGVNNLTIESFDKVIDSSRIPLPFNLHDIPFNLDPYYMVNEDEEPNTGFSSVEIHTSNKLKSFNIDSLYGNDVIRKVAQFAEIVTNVAGNFDFDVIHAHDWMTMLAGIKIKQITGKPLVMHIHSREIDRSGESSRGWVYDLEQKGMEYADMLIPVSQFTSNIIQTHYGINNNKIEVVHNGSNRVHTYKSKRPFKEKLVLFVGRLTRQKGPEKFLEIAARVLSANPDVRFVMAGSGEHFKAVLESSAYKHLGHRFHLTGFLNSEQLHYMFSISDVYCMPSVSEPFGLSAIEAAQFGIPCVISKQSGVAEVLHGSLKFDHWDTHKASDYILSLLSNATLGKNLSNDANIDLSKISWDVSAEKVLAAYSKHNLI